MEYKNLDVCIDYIQDCMLKLGHFDGLMGFSQVPSLLNFYFFYIFRY